MLKLTNVCKTYDDFRLDCSLEVQPGSITGFIGSNGAGKSTTFKAILGLIRTEGGQIEVLGAPAADKRRLGVAMAETGFSGELTVRDVGRILAAFYPEFDADFYRAQTAALSLPENKRIKEFSTGMKAKLKVLSAISHRAELLLLDEPTAGLDVLARDQILELLRQYVEADERRAILISSHISGDLEQLCDDFYMIDDGKIVCHEETDRLLSDYAILKVEDDKSVDPQYILRRRRESFGWSLLTDQKQYYLENNPRLVIERVTMDDFITMMLKGETL